MKLKNVLLTTFLILTLIPVLILALLVYISGFNLSKNSYMKNLNESINVQSDYISQAIEGDMISDYRFARKMLEYYHQSQEPESEIKSELLSNFRSYLENSEDKLVVCALLDRDGNALYTIGEKSALDVVNQRASEFSTLENQTLFEFKLGEDIYSLGAVTPVKSSNGEYLGSLVSIYDKSYIFKIISSYYEISDTSTYLYRQDNNGLSPIGLSDEKSDNIPTDAISRLVFDNEGVIEISAGKNSVLGYYKNIYSSNWYLMGVIDQNQIFSFINQYIWVYILIIALVFIADILLAIYISKQIVHPINYFISIIDGYPESIDENSSIDSSKHEYLEIKYLRTKFISLAKRILLIQHNFEGIYHLYQSNTMDDINIDIDVMKQTINSNKDDFRELIETVAVPDGACIVERFTNCFCNNDQHMLMDMFVDMRDHHLSITREAKVFTPYMGQKWFHILVVPMYEADRLSRLFVQLRDISSFKKRELESIEQAQREPLTGLYNRLGFGNYVSQALDNTMHGETNVFMFIDMNDFKLVNDNFGHDAGDDLLRSIAAKLLYTLGNYGAVSRFGGDEFAIFLPNTSPEKAEGMRELLNENLIYPYTTKNGDTFEVSASIGIAISDDPHSCQLDSMIKLADENMYEVKRKIKENRRR